MSIESTTLATPSGPAHNLPLQLTSFIGRERETAEVKRLLDSTRLLTLTGAGGCGKTRLALRAAAEMAGVYRDGIWLVELAALADAALVPEAVASALGVREGTDRTVHETLVDYLRTKSPLIILDNCEHLVDAVARFADALLRGCRQVRILATSREALACAGETTWRVPSMTVPAAMLPIPRPSAGDGSGGPDPMTSDAVRLFVERALAAQPSFRVSDRNTPALIEICRRLDGMPLAIELAAARVKLFSVEQIAARLDDRFRLLTAGGRTTMPRHQTLRALVDWSHQLLSEPEQTLLRRLSVFAGGWTFEAAEAVGAGDGIQTHAVLDLLAQLVDKSLVIAEEERGAARYHLLETIRQYAREKLLTAGEAERIRRRHLDYYLKLAEDAEPEMRGPRQRDRLVQLEADHDNLRAALEWSAATDSDAALRHSAALASFWWMRSHYVEGRRRLERALADTTDRSVARMKALHGAAWLAHHQRDADTAKQLLGEGLSIARELGDRRAEAWALHVLGRIAYFDDDPATAHSFGQDSLAIAEEVGDDWLIAWALHLLGLAAHISADYPSAQAYYARSLAIRRELGYQEGIAILLSVMGIAAFRQGDAIQAGAHYREAIEIMQSLGGPWTVGPLFAAFSGLAATQGQPIRAVRLAGAATLLGETYQMLLLPIVEPVLAEGLELARQALDEAAFATAWAEGRAMTQAQCIAEALAVEVTPHRTPAARAPDSRNHDVRAGLTLTEARILRLLASGRTTREIAGELVVAISTVDRHLTHIYQKLGVRNRAAATAFALKHGLA